MNRLLSLIILLIFATSNTFSQDLATEETLEKQDLNNQYKALKEKAETYGEYKVFRESKLNEFWSSVNDSISILRENLDGKQLVIDGQKEEIENLNLVSKENEERFQQNEFAATHISFLGVNFTKSTFKIVMSIMVSGLSLMLILGYLQYSRNKEMAVKNASECNKLEREMEDLRKKSLEKQIRLNRDLQTERNKIEELRNKSTISKRISA